MSFDPCREWLGIDAVDLDDPHRVLGVPVSLTDPTAIAAAAEARLAALRGFNPGPFARAHGALVERVVEARQTLLDRLPEAAPPPVWAAPSPADDEPGPEGVSSPEPPAVAPEPDADGPTLPGSSRASLRPVRRSSGSQDDLTGLVLSLGALLAAASIIAFFVVQGPTGSGVAFQAAGDASARPLQASPSLVARASPPEIGERAARTRPAEPFARVDDPTIGRPPRRPRPAPPHLQDLDPESAPSLERRRPADPLAERPPARQPTRPPPAAEPPRRSAPDQRLQEHERARLREAVEAALGDAYVALQRQEFDSADRAINAASRQVGDDVEAAGRVEAWRLFAAYARSFVGYRDQAFRAANAGREYALGDTRFAVIEITPEKFVYRLRGKTVRMAPDQVDPRIILAIVEAWFAADGRTANHLFLGARALCLDPPDLRRARAAWQLAGQGGEHVGPLLALLDDPVIHRAGGR